MGKLTFKGGIHPYEGKELAKNQPVEKYLPKGDMVYLMSQHIGAPSVPCVKKGDQVLAGQKIADAALEDLTKEEILNRIKEGGVVGMGGAGFPTHVKLAPKDPSKIEYVLVNGAECEPYITSDYRRMLEEPEKVVEDLR